MPGDRRLSDGNPALATLAVTLEEDRRARRIGCDRDGGRNLGHELGQSRTARDDLLGAHGQLEYALVLRSQEQPSDLGNSDVVRPADPGFATDKPAGNEDRGSERDCQAGDQSLVPAEQGRESALLFPAFRRRAFCLPLAQLVMEPAVELVLVSEDAGLGRAVEPVDRKAVGALPHLAGADVAVKVGRDLLPGLENTPIVHPPSGHRRSPAAEIQMA